MQGHQHDAHDSSGPGRHRGFRIAGKWVLIGFIAIAGYLLLSEHRAHAIEFLPFLLLLACPVLHMLHGHGGHGRHQHGDERRDGNASRREHTEGGNR